MRERVHAVVGPQAARLPARSRATAGRSLEHSAVAEAHRTRVRAIAASTARSQYRLRCGMRYRVLMPSARSERIVQHRRSAPHRPRAHPRRLRGRPARSSSAARWRRAPMRVDLPAEARGSRETARVGARLGTHRRRPLGNAQRPRAAHTRTTRQSRAREQRTSRCAAQSGNST